MADRERGQTKVTIQYGCNVLGVGKFTSPDLCMVEAGIAPLQHIIAVRRRRFLEGKLSIEHADEPLYEVFEWCRRDNTPGYRFMQQALQYDCTNPLSSIATRIRGKPQTASKFLTYRTDLNRTLTVHGVYQTKEWIPDYKRQAFTRLRLMSHNLKIETGRRGELP